MNVITNARRGASLLALFVTLTAASAGPPAFAQKASESPAAAVRQYRDAVAFQNRGVYDLAVDEWNKFLEKYPEDPLAPKARHYAGVCKLQLKRYDEAQADFEKVIKDNPKFDLLDVTYLNLGLTQYNLAQADKPELFDKAAATLATLVEKFPDSKQAAQALYYQGESLYGRSKKAEAAKVYSRLVDKYPTAPQRPDALYALGAAQEELGQSAEAGATYDKFLRDFTDHPLRAEVILRRAETLFAQRQFPAAEKWFASAAAAKDFASADQAQMRQAASLYEQKKYAESGALYAAVPEKFPQSQLKAPAALAAGNCFYLAGDPNKSKSWLTLALSAGGPTAVEAAHWLARIAISEQKFADAISTIDQVIQDSGDAPYAVNLMMDQADALFEMPDRRAEAIDRYAALATTHPKHDLAPHALYMAGFTALGAGRHEAAADYASKFMAAYANDRLAPDVKYVAAEASIQLGHHAEAERQYRELIKAAPQHADANAWKLRLALSLFLQKKYDDAAKHLQPLLAVFKSPEQVAEAQHLIGSSQLELKQYDAAAKSLKAALAAAPKWRQADETLLNLAATQKQQNKLDDARATIAQLLRDVPQSKLLDRAHYRLGEYAYAAGDYPGAAVEYQSVLDKWSNSPLAANAVYGLGWTQLGQKDYAASEKTLSRFIEKHADHELAPRAYYARAMVRQQLKQHDQALADVDAFLKTEPKGAERFDALYVKGLVLAGQMMFADATKAFRSILQEDPSYAAADKVRYELAWALKSQNDEQGASEAFRELARQHASSPLAAEALYHVAESAYSANDYSGAAETYYAAMTKAGKSDVGEKAAHKLGWSYYQQGQFDKSQQIFAEQLTNYPQGELAADGRFMSAESLFKLNKYEPALQSFAAVLAAPPANKDFVDLALLHAAQTAGQLEDWKQVHSLVGRHQKDFPESPYKPEVLFEEAWAIQKQGKPDESLKLYEQVAESTEREVGARARFMMGEVLFGKKDYKEAVRNYFKVAYGYGYPSAPDSIKRWQANSVYEAAICFENLNLKQQALKSYKELLEKYPTSERAADAKKRAAALEG